MNLLRPTLTIIVFLIAASPAFGQYAIDKLENMTGIKIRPKSNFAICRGSSDDPLGCKPTAGIWTKVRNVGSYSLDAARESSNATIRDAIIDRYIGAAYYGGNLDNSCAPVASHTAFRTILSTDVDRTTGIAQLIQTEIVRAGTAKFDTMIKDVDVSGVAAANARAAFEVNFRRNISNATQNLAAIKWVVVYLDADIDRLINDFSTQTSACVNIAKPRKGSLVTGIAGFVITDNQFDANTINESLFALAASSAIEASTDQRLKGISPSVVANAAASWSSSTKSKITTAVTSSDARNKFIPLWVRFGIIPQPNRD